MQFRGYFGLFFFFFSFDFGSFGKSAEFNYFWLQMLGIQAHKNLSTIFWHPSVQPTEKQKKMVPFKCLQMFLIWRIRSSFEYFAYEFDDNVVNSNSFSLKAKVLYWTPWCQIINSTFIHSVQFSHKWFTEFHFLSFRISIECAPPHIVLLAHLRISEVM